MFNCKPRLVHLGLLVLALSGLAALLAPRALPGEDQAQVERVRIGVVGSILKDVPDSMLAIINQPFNSVMKAQTGMTGELVKAATAQDLGRMLTENKVQLGIFHGVEFGWARLKHPRLKPLMIAINEHCYLKAFLVVRSDSSIAGLADMKGQQLSLPRCSRPHCQMFLERCCCSECSCGPQEHMAKIVGPPTCEDALDDVIDKVVQGCIIDSVSLEVYKKRKPGRFAKLRIATESETFPAAVVAYYPGGLGGDELGRFQNGMKNANQTIVGKQLLTLMKLSGFDAIPEDYDQVLNAIVQCYPPPAVEEKK